MAPADQVEAGQNAGELEVDVGNVNETDSANGLKQAAAKYSKVSYDRILLRIFDEYIGSSQELTSTMRPLARYYVMWARKEAPQLYQKWKDMDAKYGSIDGKTRKFKPGEFDERDKFIAEFSNMFDMMGFLPNKGQHDVERPYILQDVIDDWDAHVYEPGTMMIIRGKKGSGKSNFITQECIRLASKGYLVASSNQLNIKAIARDFGPEVASNIHCTKTLAQLLEVRARDMLSAATRNELTTMVFFHDDMDMLLGALRATGKEMETFNDLNILLRKLGIIYVGTYHQIKIPKHVAAEVRVWIRKGYYHDHYMTEHDFSNPKQSYSITVEDFNYPDVYGVPDFGPYFYTGVSGDFSLKETPVISLSSKLSRLTTDSPKAAANIILDFLKVRVRPWEKADAPPPWDFMNAMMNYACKECGNSWEDEPGINECHGCHGGKLLVERTEKPLLLKEHFVRYYGGYEPRKELADMLRNAGRSDGRPYDVDEYLYFKERGLPDTLLCRLYLCSRDRFPTKDEKTSTDQLDSEAVRDDEQ